MSPQSTNGGRWFVVYTAPNLPIAEMIRDFLKAEGLNAAVRPRGLSPYIAVDAVEVLAALDQREQALEAIRAFLDDQDSGVDAEEPE